MRYLFASDLHGSYRFGRELMEAFEREKADKLVLLGDLLYHGARNDLPEEYDTKALTALLNHYKDSILAVRGNCDAEIDQMVLEFPMMGDYIQLYADGHDFLVTHGHLFNEHSMIPHAPGTVLVHGHTHVKAAMKLGDIWYLNPGSVTMPKDDDKHSYLIYENNRFTFKELSGNVISTFELK